MTLAFPEERCVGSVGYKAARLEFQHPAVYSQSMKREELARTLAKQAHLSGARARDRIDGLVHRILKSLRSGEPVELPGVGRLMAKPDRRSSAR